MPIWAGKEPSPRRVGVRLLGGLDGATFARGDGGHISPRAKRWPIAGRASFGKTSRSTGSLGPRPWAASPRTSYIGEVGMDPRLVLPIIQILTPPPQDLQEYPNFINISPLSPVNHFINNKKKV